MSQVKPNMSLEDLEVLIKEMSTAAGHIAEILNRELAAGAWARMQAEWASKIIAARYRSIQEVTK